MDRLFEALNAFEVAWRAWGETNYNVRDDAFQQVLHAVSILGGTYSALKDAGVIATVHLSQNMRQVVE